MFSRNEPSVGPIDLVTRLTRLTRHRLSAAYESNISKSAAFKKSLSPNKRCNRKTKKLKSAEAVYRVNTVRTDENIHASVTLMVFGVKIFVGFDAYAKEETIGLVT